MSNKSNNQGRGYEFSFIQSLEQNLTQTHKIEIQQNTSYHACKKAWSTLNFQQQKDYLISANAGINIIKQLEPVLVDDKAGKINIKLQSDQAGIIGDVRDVIVSCEEISWEIGMSLKHNHDAIKHSRISEKIDFGKNWYEVPCSAEYWHAVTPIFERLSKLKQQSINWRDLKDKEQNIYLPLLNAFQQNIKQAYDKYGALIPRRMVEYLLGKFDFYKVISVDNKRLTIVQPFNLRGKLNQCSEKLKPEIKISTAILPSEIIAIQLRKNSLTTVDLYLDAGWSISFRLHNASTKVEPSLKFDIKFLGMPDSITELIVSWDN